MLAYIEAYLLVTKSYSKSPSACYVNYIKINLNNCIQECDLDENSDIIEGAALLLLGQY